MRTRIGAAALAAAFAFAPFTSALALRPAAPSQTAQQQQDDTPPEAEQKIFSQGRDLFAQGRYEQAATVFSDFLKKYPNSFISDLMLLWLGRTYIELGKLPDAEQVGQRLRAMPDTPFTVIFDSELETARRAAPAETAGRTPATAAPSPSETAVVRATPTPAPVRPAPTPRPTPTEIARNRPRSNTPTLNIRGEGTESRPRTTRQQPSRRATAPVVRPTPVPPALPTPTPARRETRVQVAAATPSPVAPTRSAPDASSDTGTVSPAPAGAMESGQGGFSLTVKQVPDLQLALRRAALAAQPGQSIQLPLVITNTGNKEDQFRVETDLPAEYQPAFSGSGTDTGMPIYVTPTLQRGATLEVNLNLRVPDNAPDNQQQRFLVRAASQASSSVLKVADASLTVVAAALAATSNVTEDTVMPNGTFTQRINVRNLGSATARSARADFVFNPDFELVSATPAPINYDRPSRTAIWSLGELESRDTREITITMRAVQDALASTNTTLGRGTMRTQSLSIPSNFDGPTINVGRVPRAQIDSVSPGLTATPGDTIFVPFIVRNPSNYPESFDLRITAPGAPVATIYADANGDGQHQDGEPAVTQTASLDPRGGQYPVLLRVEIPRTTPDRQQFAYNLVTRAMNSAERTASEASTVLTVATPRVRVRPEYGTAEVKPGDTIFYRLVLVNDGGGLAKSLSVTETLPDALEFVSSAPSLSVQDSGGGSSRSFVWRVPELAPGDTSVLLVTVRVRPNIPADSVLTPRHSLGYQDTNGNIYRGQ